MSEKNKEIISDELSDEEKKEIDKSISGNLSSDETSSQRETKRGRSAKDKPTPEETKSITEEEAAALVDDETKNLYNDFKGFLETKKDIKEDESEGKNVIPTGIDLLDAELGGGFAIGAFNIIIGAPGSGKSMLAMQTMGSCQRVYPGSIAAFLDAEMSTTTIRLSNLGVNKPKIKPYGDITVEKVFQFLEGVCLFKESKGIIDIPSIIIWDSIANTLTQKEIETDDMNQVIGYKARLLSLLLPKYVAKASQYNICLLAVNQLRDVMDLGQFTAPKDLKFMSHTKNMPGGQSIKFNAFQLIEMKIAGVIDNDKYGINGIKAKVKSVKNKLFPCNVEVLIFGDFVTGFNNFWTNYAFLVDGKRISSGAWNYIVDYPTKKFRTKDALTVYNEDPIFKESFDNAVKETIQTEIVEKYNPKF